MNASELARSFADILGEWLTPEQFAEMRLRNVQYVNDNICASHDYCDANMAMIEAFNRVLGREPASWFANDSDADMRLMDEAWNIAKREYLTAPN